jgi:hypothetical protein
MATPFQLERHANASDGDGLSIEQHYSPAEIAERWNLSQDAVRKIFENEPGVLVVGNRQRHHKRRYTTLRIPQSVLERVHRRLSKV